MPLHDLVLTCENVLPFGLRTPGSADAVALAAPGRSSLGYAELARHIGSLRRVLAGAGIRPSRTVALSLPGGPEYIAIFLAVAASGACAPLDGALTELECATSLGRLGAQAIICEEGTAAWTAAAALNIEILTVRVPPEGPAGLCTLTPEGRPMRDVPATDAALLLQTSATTGTPKLVPISRANLQAMVAHDVRALALTAADHFLCLMPLFHLHGISAVLTQLAAGGAVMATAGFDAARFPEWLAEFRPTWFSSAPAIHHAILACVRDHPDAFRSTPLRLIRSTGAGLDPALLAELEAASGVPVLEGYGLTETGGVARNTLASRKAGSVGKSSGLEMAILDARGLPAPIGSEGEIVVRGPSVVSGYSGDAEATQAAFRNGWFHTGDLGRIDSDGFLFLSGRLKEIINRGGEKVSPFEVEHALAAHPAVAEAVCFPVPHRTLGEDVAATVVLRTGQTISPIELRRFAATQLAPFKLPRQITIVDSIPRGATGKPKRTLLAREAARRAERSELLDPLSRELATIWQRILGVEEIGAEDDFFALGGDSLSATVMLTEALAGLHAEPESFAGIRFFEEPTIQSLARLIGEARTGSGDGACIALRNSGCLAPVFYVPASGQGPYYARHLAKELGDEQPFFVVPPPQYGDTPVRIEEAAASFVAAIRAVRHEGPYILAGHCYGGVVAFEAARKIILDGSRVSCLVLFDIAAPGYPKITRSWRRYAGYARTMLSGLLRGRPPIGHAEAAAHLRVLRQIVARRMLMRPGRMAPAFNRTPPGEPGQKARDGMAMRA